MRSAPSRLLLAALIASGASAAAAPRVATDVAPVHSIVAAVMAGVGAPDLIVPPGASPHGYAMRPSEASALAAADLVVWVGPALTPWLAEPLDALAPEAARLSLLDAAGVRTATVRSGDGFEAHDHAGETDHEAHGDEPGNAHADEHADGHAEETEAAHAEEDAGVLDPHLWLDPRNAVAAAAAVAVALAEIDPANAGVYADNAAAFAAATHALEVDILLRLAPLQDRRFFVFHDAYQYFERRFDLPAAGSIALNDAEPPRAGRVAALRERFLTEQIVCVFAEPQFQPKLIATLVEGVATRQGTIDPLGAGLTPGPELYPALLTRMADDLQACLGPRS